MNTTIQIQVRDNFGSRVAYPICENAKLFASIAGTQTLTAKTIAKIKCLGFTIRVEMPPQNEVIEGLS